MKQKFLLFVVASVVSLCCLIIEIAAVDELQRNSADYIYDLQKGNTSSAENFFKFVSAAAEYIAMGIGFLCFVWTGGGLGVMCMLCVFFSTWLGDVLKMAIAHPRPFWTDSRIIAMRCPTDFGAPSGHALTVGSVILFFYFRVIKNYKIISTAVAAGLLGLLALDRNYLGVHFYFQVVLGYAIACLVVSGLNFPQVWEYLAGIKRNWIRLLAVEIGCLGCLLFGVLIFFVRDPSVEESWIHRFEEKCSGSIYREKILFRSLIESSCIMIIAGIVLGLSLDRFSVVYGWKTRLAGIVIICCFGAIEQYFESLAKTLDDPAAFILFCILRFVVGVFIAYVVPLVQSKIYKVNTESGLVN